MHEPRYIRKFTWTYLLDHVRDWPPGPPDAQLPAPWSCDWERFDDAWCWHGNDGDGPQEVITELYGPALRRVVPALFHPLSPRIGAAREDVVLCPPGGAGTYYLWWNEDFREARPEVGEMLRFEGLYASVAHFVRTADWNRLEGVPLVP